ncbi:MAG: hypothetical protein VCE43_09605 [Myxococcota bacterium]
MGSDESEFMAGWHRIVETRDLDALGTILAEEPASGAPRSDRSAGLEGSMIRPINTLEAFIDGARDTTDDRALRRQRSGRLSHDLFVRRTN